MFSVNVVSWVFGTLVGNHFILDIFWVFTNTLSNIYFKYHPLASFNETRSNISFFLIIIWTLRLNYNLARKDGFQIGVRQDWRYTLFQERDPKNWWWKSFFWVYASQHIMIAGLFINLWAVNFGSSCNSEFGSMIDIMGVSLTLLGLIIAYYADTQ